MRAGLDTAFKAFKREPGAFPVVLVALPDFGDEACLGGELLHQGKQLHPVDFTIVDLQAFAINAFGIGQMQVCRERKDRLEEATEGGVEVVQASLEWDTSRQTRMPVSSQNSWMKAVSTNRL